MSDKEYNPLVSVTVITYNSSKYVLETLESIKAQTYQNIELIVSDDCSTDNTVEICREWIEKNKSRFVETHLITSPVNTGIPANKNRAIAKCKGEWVKGIAGDDALFPNAIKDLIGVVNNKIPSRLILTQIEVFKNDFKPENSIGIKPRNLDQRPFYLVGTTPQVQIEYLLKGGFHYTPGLFIKSDIFSIIGLYEESFTLNEDIPFYLKAGLKNELIAFEQIVTVKYRKHNGNITRKNEKILQPYLPQVSKAIFNASLKYRKTKFVLNAFWNLALVRLIFLGGNKGWICSQLNSLRMTLQPIRFFNMIKKLSNYRFEK